MLFDMHFIIGFALVLFSGSMAAQQGAVDESTAVQECYAPKVWAYCAGPDGSALPPACIDPEKQNPDPSKPKLCASSCSCDKPADNPATENNKQTLEQSPPSRSYPPPRVLQWGERPDVPAVEKSLIKNPQLKSGYVPFYELAEYPVDSENIIQQSQEDGTQVPGPNGGVIIGPPSGEENPIPNLDNLPPSNNEMFKLDGGFFNQNYFPPNQHQTPPNHQQTSPTLEQPNSGSRPPDPEF